MCVRDAYSNNINTPLCLRWTPPCLTHVHLNVVKLLLTCAVILMSSMTFYLQILCDLLSPVDENVKVGLRETSQNLLPHLRTKTLVEDAPVLPQSLVLKEHQHQVSASSADYVDHQKVSAQRRCSHIHFYCFDPDRFLLF